MRKLSNYLFCITFIMLASCQDGSKKSVVIIPQPLVCNVEQGGLTIKELSSIKTPADWSYLAENFVAQSQSDLTVELSINEEKGDIEIAINDALAKEAYKMSVDGDRVEIEASHVAGAFNALQTLRQLMLTSTDGEIPNLVIEDSPRFEYRGLMIDCSRHFWSVDDLKKSIDQMALFKLNKLHLHITDNNAWRLEMDKYPELVKKGTFYSDFPELSGKFYTKEDLKEVVAYAAQRNIEVIPEVDLPGHATALMATLPNLSCNGGEFEPYPEERALNLRKRGNENMLCIGNAETLQFAEDVVDALIEIFPSKYIHLGGDEVPTKVWEKCPKCMALYKKEGMSDIHEIQDYFTRNISKMILSKGKVMIGWGEINDRNVATPQDVVMVWRNDGIAFQKMALDRNVPIVMTPQHGCYYDWGYAGNSTRKVYEWDPVGENVTEDKLHLIKGAQACLWTERIATQSRVEWMLYPRVSALSEVMWSDVKQRNWDSFFNRITAFYPVFERLGINFYEDDTLNEKEFVPSSEKPALIRHAHIDTNIPIVDNYHAEYAFDGRSNSFFWGGLSIGKSHYFKVILGEPTVVNEIKIITGDSKDYITMADLMVSVDGENFEKVSSFDELGEANAKLDGKTIKAVMIQVTDQHTCWPVIKEIIIK